MKNVREREYAEFLYDRGEQAVRGILAFCEKNKDQQYLNDYESPYLLETNWNKIIRFADRNGL